MAWQAQARALTSWPRGLVTTVRREVLPDYNRAAARAWWLCLLAGAAVLVWGLASAAAAPPPTAAWLALLCLLAAACAPFHQLTRPDTSVGVDGSEFLVMVTLLAFGPAAAPLVAACNAGAGAWLSSRRWSTWLFSPAATALSAALAGALHAALGDGLALLGLGGVWAEALRAAAAGITYFAAGTLLVSAVPRLKRGQPVIDWRALWANRWPGLAFAGGALSAFLVWHSLQARPAPGWLPALASAGLLLGGLLVLALGAVHNERRKARAAEARALAMSLLAETDPLTGLGNRRGFELALDAGPAALLLLDVDGFKQVNDRRGHPAGDRLLQLIAQRLRHEIRPADRLLRLGGDEFAVLLDATLPAADVAALAQRLVEAMRQPFRIDGALVRVGISLGVARPAAGRSDLLARADQALLDAKRQGKNRWCEADVNVPPAL